MYIQDSPNICGHETLFREHLLSSLIILHIYKAYLGKQTLLILSIDSNYFYMFCDI